MVSEIDIRDWDRVDFKKINDVIDDLPLEEYNDPVLWASAKHIEDFVREVNRLRNKQIADAKRKIPAILRKGEE